MHHNVDVRKFEREHFRKRYPYERHVTLVTQGLITYISGRRWVTLRSESVSRVDPLPQKMVEPALRGEHPLHPNMVGTPFTLEVSLQELRHPLQEVERPAIAEVQTRPSHDGGVYAR